MIRKTAAGVLLGALVWFASPATALAQVSAQDHRDHRGRHCWDEREHRRHGDRHRDCRRDDDCRKGRYEYRDHRDHRDRDRDRDCRDRDQDRRHDRDRDRDRDHHRDRDDDHNRRADDHGLGA